MRATCIDAILWPLQAAAVVATWAVAHGIWTLALVGSTALLVGSGSVEELAEGALFFGAAGAVLGLPYSCMRRCPPRVDGWLVLAKGFMVGGALGVAGWLAAIAVALAVTFTNRLGWHEVDGWPLFWAFVLPMYLLPGSLLAGIVTELFASVEVRRPS